jgi:nitroreductase
MPYIVYSDLAIAAVYLHLAASTLGLATHWVSSVGEPRLGVFVKDLVGIPRNWELYELFAVGYPASEPRPRYVRSREELIHRERLDQSRIKTDEQMKQYINKIRDSWAGKIAQNK